MTAPEPLSETIRQLLPSVRADLERLVRIPSVSADPAAAPHLRDSAEPAAAEPADEQADDRSPEQARALASSLQTGWRRGRQDDPANAAFPPSPRQDPTAANREEA